MNTIRVCPNCGTPLPHDAPAGLCPKCLLEAGFASNSGAPNPTLGFTPPEPAEIARFFPQLEIIELIGFGGMGVVYRARQKALDRVVALKILPAHAGRDAAFAERFNREARALARLSHPNIVGIFDFGHADGLYFFLMEFVDGVNLRQLLAARQLSAREALAIVPQICDALQYAHDEGVVHRDIKPENILVDRKGRVRIADFGLAKLMGAATEGSLTQSQHVMGTPHYMAPEQTEHPLDVDHRADIYSLGVVLYEMLTGELPLGRFAPPSQKRKVDARLDDVVLKTLEKEPARRYQQASEIKSDVENVAGVPLKHFPPSMQRMFGAEYKSPRTFGKWPLLHIAFGLDPQTGKPREAAGVIAIGNKATGVLAFGGVARGFIAFGGVALGFIAVGGVAAGLVTVGGLAIGLLFGYGGLAVGLVSFGGLACGYAAVGGLAAGYYAMGGAAFGAHVLSATLRDPAAQRFFDHWPKAAEQWLTGAALVLIALSQAVVFAAWFWMKWRQSRTAPPPAQ